MEDPVTFLAFVGAMWLLLTLIEVITDAESRTDQTVDQSPARGSADDDTKF